MEKKEKVRKKRIDKVRLKVKEKGKRVIIRKNKIE